MEDIIATRFPKDTTATRVPKVTTYKNRWKKEVHHILQSRYIIKNRGLNFHCQAARYLLAQNIFYHPTMTYIYDSHGK